MTERKNLKIDPEMYDRLREEKEQYETWNHLFNRLLKRPPIQNEHIPEEYREQFVDRSEGDDE